MSIDVHHIVLDGNRHEACDAFATCHLLSYLRAADWEEWSIDEAHSLGQLCRINGISLSWEDDDIVGCNDVTRAVPSVEVEPVVGTDNQGEGDIRIGFGEMAQSVPHV